MFRANSSAIQFIPREGPKYGGKAEVVQATFKRRIWDRKQRVAVKKLQFHGGMDSYMFTNVRRSMIPNR